MTDTEFDALVSLIQAHIVHARLTEGRQYDRPHMDARQRELHEKIEAARDVFVPQRLRSAQHEEEDAA